MDTKPTRAIEGKCLHYNGTKNECCDAGVNYMELKGDAAGVLFDVLPCFGKAMKRDKPCAKRLLPTLEQVNAWKQYTNARLVHTLEAIGIITEQNKTDKKGRGLVVCPACGGNLHYTVAGYNGHVHGSCETQECLQWMQ
jgi:hypothetical protein